MVRRGVGAVSLLALWGLLAARWLPTVSPPLALAGTLFAFLAPGWLASSWLVQTGPLSLIERLPLALALSAGVLAAPAVLLSPDIPRFSYLVLALAAVAVVVGGVRHPSSPLRERASHRMGWAVVALAFVATLVSAVGPRDRDDWLYLGWINRLLQAPDWQWNDLRYELNAWFVYEAMFSHLSGIPSVAVVQTWLPPLLAALSLFAFYGFCGEVCGNRRLAFWATALQLAMYLTDLAPTLGLGRVFLLRAGQDKAVATFLLLPVAFRLAIGLAQRWTWRQTIALGIVGVGLVGTHLQGVALFVLLAGPFLALRLWLGWRERQGGVIWLRLLPLALALALIPLGWWLRSAIAANRLWFALNDLTPFQVQFFNGLRFFSLSHTLVILPPQLLMHPVKLLAVVLLPYLLRLSRRHPPYQFLALSLTIPLALLYVPWVMTLFSSAVGILYAWRFLWFLPAGPVIVVVLAHARRALVARWRGARFLPLLGCWGGVASVIIVAGFLLRGNLVQSYSALAVREGRATADELAFMDCVTAFVTPHHLVMAPRFDNWYLFGLIPRVVVFFFHGQNRAGGGLQTLNRFYPEQPLTEPPALFDRERLGLLRGVRYVIVPSPSQLAFEMGQMKGWFTRRCEGGGRSLWQVGDISDAAPLVAANTALVAGRWAEAAKAYAEAIADGQGGAQAWLGLAWARQQQGDVVQAEAAYRQAVAAAPSEPWPRLYFGRYLARQGDLIAAQSELAQATALAPRLPVAHEVVADFWFAQGDTAQADAALRTAARLRLLNACAWPDPWQQAQTVASLYAERGRTTEAIAAYRQATRWADTVDLQLALASLWMAQGDVQAAERAYRWAVWLNVGDMRPHMALGDLYRARGRFAEASLQYRLALWLDYWTPEAHLARAEMALAQGQDAAAERELWLALGKLERVMPGSTAAHRLLAPLMAGQGRWSEAAGVYWHATTKAPDDAELRVLLAQALQESGRLADAVGQWQAAVRLAPAWTVAVEGLAAACRQASGRQMADVADLCRSASP